MCGHIAIEMIPMHKLSACRLLLNQARFDMKLHESLTIVFVSTCLENLRASMAVLRGFCSWRSKSVVPSTLQMRSQ